MTTHTVTHAMATVERPCQDSLQMGIWHAPKLYCEMCNNFSTIVACWGRADVQDKQASADS